MFIPTTAGDCRRGEIRRNLHRWLRALGFHYHGLPGKRREIERDGLISIADVGYLDEDGYLFLCDRKHDMVISGGVNIYPAEIEAALLALAGVRDCAVFGIPNEEFGEALCAHIEPEPGAVLDEAAVNSFLRDRLADFKVPRVIRFDTNLPREGFRQDHEAEAARPLLGSHRPPDLIQIPIRSAPLTSIVIATRGEASSGR